MCHVSKGLRDDLVRCVEVMCRVTIPAYVRAIEPWTKDLPSADSPPDGLVDDGETLRQGVIIQSAMLQSVGARAKLRIRCVD